MGYGVEFTGYINRATVQELEADKYRLEEILERNKLEFFTLAASTPRNGVDDEGYFVPAFEIVTSKAVELWESIIETSKELALIYQALEDKNATNV